MSAVIIMAIVSVIVPTLLQMFLGVEAVDEPNLALRKPASQSSTLPGPYDVRAEKAVDGSTHGNYTLGQSCSHTTEDATIHWWMVDLQAIYTIKSIRITNHLECCSHKLAQFTIEVSAEHPNTLRGFPGKTDATICTTVPGQIPKLDDFPLVCDWPVLGRYVRIVKPSVANMALVICEFKVYEEVYEFTLIPASAFGRNLALAKPATQVSTFKDGYAWKAVDGNRNEIFSEGSCSATDRGINKWWQVDLLESHLIGSISIVNRLDWASWNLRKLVVEISEGDPSTLDGFPGKTNSPICVSLVEKVLVPGPINFKCHQPLYGRYVRLLRSSYSMPIYICEVEVYAPEPTMVSTKAQSPTPVPRGISGDQTFQYVTSKGSSQAISSAAAKRGIKTCGQRFLLNMVDVQQTPFMQVDTITGTCQYLKSTAEGQNSLSNNWVIYKAPNLKALA